MFYKEDFTGNLNDEIKWLREILEVILSFEKHLEYLNSNIKFKIRIFCNYKSSSFNCSVFSHPLWKHNNPYDLPKNLGNSSSVFLE